MFRKKIIAEMIVLLLLPFSIVTLPITSSNAAITSKQPRTSPVGYRQEKVVNRAQLHSSSHISSPSTLRAEFINPNHPNYMQAFVNVSFDITVLLSAVDFNYTQVNASITFGSPTETDPLFSLVEGISKNTRTQFIGNLAAGENATITWKAILNGYDAEKPIHLLWFNASGFLNGIIFRAVVSQDLIETHFPAMIVDGPFPVEEHENADYELDYEETKSIMLNITSGISGTYNLTEVEVTIDRNYTGGAPALIANYSSPQIKSLAPGEFYLFNFTITSISKKKAGILLIIYIASYTPTYRQLTAASQLYIIISLLKAPESNDFGPIPIETFLIFFGVFSLASIFRRRKR